MSNLKVSQLVVKYGNVMAVDHVSFSVAEGEFISLLGPSGCGKTSALRCIAGLESAVSGTIHIGDDCVVSDGFEMPPELRGVNMVFQSYAVWPHMSVFDNVAYGLKTKNIAISEIERRVTEVLRLVGLENYGKRYGTELSGGQQQRVAVARAVVTEPRLLLFDEPLSNLDAGLRERMRFELLALQRRLGRTSIYVTHDQAEAMVMSDRIILMSEGRVVQESSPRELYERPANRFAAGFVGNANLVDGELIASHGQGRYSVRLPGGLELQGYTSRADWEPKPSVLICIRPENIRPAAEGFNTTVNRVSYLGPIQTVEVQTGALTLRADVSSNQIIEAGTSMTFHIDPSAVVLVPEN